MIKQYDIDKNTKEATLSQDTNFNKNVWHTREQIQQLVRDINGMTNAPSTIFLCVNHFTNFVSDIVCTTCLFKSV